MCEDMRQAGKGYRLSQDRVAVEENGSQLWASSQDLTLTSRYMIAETGRRSGVVNVQRSQARDPEQIWLDEA